MDQAAGFAMTFFQEKISSHRKILEQFIERHLFDFFSNHFDVARGHMGLGRTRRLGVGSDIFFYLSEPTPSLKGWVFRV